MPVVPSPQKTITNNRPRRWTKEETWRQSNYRTAACREIPDGQTVGQFAESIGRGLAKAAIVGRVDGKLVDLSHKLVGDHEVAIVTDKDADALYVLRHSTAPRAG